LELRGDGDFATKSLGRDTSGEMRRQKLYYNAPPERDLLRDEDMGHASAFELLLDAVCAAERCLKLIAEVRHARRKMDSRLRITLLASPYTLAAARLPPKRKMSA